jgi:hypothetical protein
MRYALFFLVLTLSACGGQSGAESRGAFQPPFDAKATKRCLEDLGAVVTQYSAGEPVDEDIPALRGKVLEAVFEDAIELPTAYVGLARDEEAAQKFARQLRTGDVSSVTFDRIRRHDAVVTWGFLELKPVLEGQLLDCVKTR